MLTENTPAPTNRPVPGKRRQCSRGSQVLEFTFCFLPLLAMTTVLLDTAWAVMAKATIQRAVRVGVRTGITLTASSPQITAGGLTGTVKGIVQSNSLGLLNGATGLTYIKVNYYAPPATGSSSPVSDVSTCAAVSVSCPTLADVGGNIMQVSVQGLVIPSLIPRVFGGNGAVDNNPTTVTVYSADLIEPHDNPPAVGTAP
jgi:Flp pilus assembly protein TadG